MGHDRRNTHYLFAHDDVLYAEPSELEVIGRIQEETGIPFLVVKRTGQIRFELEPEARTRLERITFAEGLAKSLKPRLDMDNVVVAAERFFGKPKIVNTGISPVAVAQLVRSGTPIETVAELYDLRKAVIEEAGRFTYGSRWILAA